MGLFSKPTPRSFDPAPPPMTPREWSEGKVDEQEQSSFAGKLPAEVRNHIYYWIFRHSGDLEEMNIKNSFQVQRDSCSRPAGDETNAERGYYEDGNTSTSSTSKSLRKKLESAHPLSLLSTCRKVNQEATLLAFHHHTFVSRKNASAFHNLQYRTSTLSSEQINVISSLAYEVIESHIYYSPHIGSFIASSLLLFPNLANIEVRISKRSLIKVQSLLRPHTNYGFESDNERLNRVPNWLASTIKNVTNGRAFAWQKGQKWSVEWPQEKNGSATLVHFLYAVSEHESAARAMEGAGGIEPCVCGCGKSSWLMADLVQETGRRVRVRVLFYGSFADAENSRELQNSRVRLIPGTEPQASINLPGVTQNDASGFGWSPESDYWYELQSKNRGLLSRLWDWKGRNEGR